MSTEVVRCNAPNSPSYASKTGKARCSRPAALCKIPAHVEFTAQLAKPAELLADELLAKFDRFAFISSNKVISEGRDPRSSTIAGARQAIESSRQLPRVSSEQIDMTRQRYHQLLKAGRSRAASRLMLGYGRQSVSFEKYLEVTCQAS